MCVEASVWKDLSAHSLSPIGESITLLLEADRASTVIRSEVDEGHLIILIRFLMRLEESG